MASTAPSSRSFRLWHPALFLAAAFVVAASGCKPGARDLCERYAKAQCHFEYGCCNASERATLGQGFGVAHDSEAVCVEELTKSICAFLAVYSDAEQQGRATWDYEKANACLAEMESAVSACDAEAFLGGLDDGCDISEIVTGAVPDDETCFETFECENDEAACIAEPRDDEDEDDEEIITAKGKCTPPPGIGDECPDYICTEAGWCDTGEDPPVCKAKLANGEDCTSPAQCESAVCDFTNGVCAPKKPAGTPCFTDAECASEFCDEVAGECADKRANGEPCTDNAACESDYCDFATGQCAAPDVEDVTYDICRADEQ